MKSVKIYDVQSMLMIEEENICSYITDTILCIEHRRSGFATVFFKSCKEFGNKRPKAMSWVMRSVGLNT
jgi:hypothetical protein